MRTTREKIFFGAILVFVVCGVIVFIFLNRFAIQQSLQNTPQAQITILADSAIPTLNTSLITSVTPTATFDPLITNGTGITVGVYIQISGTEGSGVNVRFTPNLNSEASFVAQESEVFQVIGGPTSQDGYTWWQISTPYDQGRQGWAVDQYLHLINP